MLLTLRGAKSADSVLGRIGLGRKVTGLVPGARCRPGDQRHRFLYAPSRKCRCSGRPRRKAANRSFAWLPPLSGSCYTRGRQSRGRAKGILRNGARSRSFPCELTTEWLQRIARHARLRAPAALRPPETRRELWLDMAVSITSILIRN